MAGLLMQPPVISAHGLTYIAAAVQPEPADRPGSRNPAENPLKRLENPDLLSDALIARAGSG
jgi:hypothetical protein